MDETARHEGEEAVRSGGAAPPPRSFGETFRAKLPELVLEAASVVFAVLLALAVDGWREGRELERLTRLAMARVEEEVRANRDQLAEARGSLERAVEGMDAALAEGGADEAPDEGAQGGAQRGAESGEGAAASERELRVELSLPLLPSAAWQAAQMSQAAAHLPLDWASLAAEAYEVQELYENRQIVAFDLLTGGGPVGPDEDEDAALGRLRDQLRTLLLLLAELETSYDEVLSAGG